MKKIFFFLLFLLKPFTLKSIISVDYFISLDIIHVSYKMDDEIKGDAKIDLMTNFTYISAQTFSPSINNLDVQNNKFPFPNKNVSGYAYHSKIYFSLGSKILDDFYVYLIPKKKNSINSFYSSFGLSFSFIDTRYSLVHQLYNAGKIQEKVFAIGKNDFVYEMGKIYFGGVPEHEIKGDEESSCDVVDDSWKCQMGWIKVGNETFELNNYKVSFRYDIREIILPVDLISSIYQKFFHEKSLLCSYYSEEKKEFFSCSPKSFDFFPDITFNINNNIYKFEIADFFENDIFHSKCLIMYDSTRLNEKSKEIILGYSFLENFVTKFDYEKSKVYFYSGKGVLRGHEKRKKNQDKIKNILKINILITLLSFLIIATNLKKN